MTAAQVLRAAAARVRQGWCTRTYDDRNGNVCAAEAMRLQMRDGDESKYAYLAAYNFLALELGVIAISTWNDRPGQTAEVVASTMERAAATLEREGK